MILCRAFSIIFLYRTRFVEFSVELIPFAFYTKLRQMNVTMRRIWSRVRMKWKRGTVEMKKLLIFVVKLAMYLPVTSR